MAVGREVTLTMRLIDRLSGPAGAAVTSLTRLNAATKAFLTAGSMGAGLRNHARGIRAATYNTTMMSGAIGLIGGAAAKSVFQFEKMGSTLFM